MLVLICTIRRLSETFKFGKNINIFIQSSGYAI